MSAVTSVSKTPIEPQSESRKRGCLFYVKRGLLGVVVLLIALVLLGVSYQTVATERDKHNYAPRGQLYTVNGHSMHIVCTGEGSPAVILQAGATADLSGGIACRPS